MTELTGKETLDVRGQNPAGQPAASTFQITTQDIANLVPTPVIPSPYIPRTPITTTGDVTIEGDYDYNLISLYSSDSTPVNYLLSADVLPGTTFYSYQTGSGQISYIPINGATVVNGTVRSLGNYSNGYYARLEYRGGSDNAWIITGNTTDGITEWSIVGSTSVNEGDTANYIIWRPDSTFSHNEGVTLTITGTDFAGSGFDQTLGQQLTALTQLYPGDITFDGVDELTIYPDAPNPIPLMFYPTPTFTDIGDRTVTIAISNPSVGEVNSGAASVETDIINVSRPWNPIELFDTYTLTSNANSVTGETILYFSDTSNIELYSTIGGTGVPVLSYVTAKSDSSITISASLTGDANSGTIFTITPAGFWFDFSDSTGMSLDGSNRCASVLDRVNGYSVVQSTSGNKPTFVASSLNSLGGLNFNGSKYMASTQGALAKLTDAARAKYTIFVVSKLNSFASTGDYIDGPQRLQANSGTSALSSSVTSLLEIPAADGVSIPYIWQYTCDGANSQAKCNSQRIFIPVTLTADALSGQKILQVDDTSSIKAAMTATSPETGGLYAVVANIDGLSASSASLITTVTDATHITVNQNLVQTIPSGTTIYFYSRITNATVPNGAKTTTNFTIGGSSTGTLTINALIYEILFVPKILPVEQMRGIQQYLSNKWSTSGTVTTAASAAAGQRKILMSSVANIHIYQTVSGTHIKPGSTVIKVNTGTNEIWLDEDIQSGGVANGATLTFHECGFKAPDVIDINDFQPTFMDGFAEGVSFSNSGEGWKPYLGSLSSPGTFPGAYGTLGHGSSNNGTAELEWNLDVFNYAPWQQYNPFAQVTNADMPTGGISITASPTPAAIADLVGYSPPQPASYPYISGYMRGAGAFYQQYGYWECRMKASEVLGAWAAFWLTPENGAWPPECDIIEGYGLSPAGVQTTCHQNRGFTATFTNRAVSILGDLLVDFSDQYVLWGVEVTPVAFNFYINREKIQQPPFQLSWDQQVPWNMQIDMAVRTADNPDRVTPMSMFVDYAAAWKAVPQVITPSGSTQPETTAIVNAMTTPPSSDLEDAINLLVESLLLYQTSFGQSLWDALDFLVVMATETAQGARINWKDPSQVGTVTGTPTFTAGLGYAGVLNTSYIDMGFVLSSASYQLNSALNQLHLGAYVDSVANTTSLAVGTSNCNLNPRSGNALNCTLWSGTAEATTTPATNGYYVATRNHFQYAFCKDSYITKPTIGDNTRTTDVQNLRIANGTARVKIAHGGTYLSPEDIYYLNLCFDQYLGSL